MKIQLYQQSRSIQCANINNTHTFSPLKVVCPLVDSTNPFFPVVTHNCLTVGSIGPWIKICQHRSKTETYLQQDLTVITSIKVKRLIRLFVQCKRVAGQTVTWSLSGNMLDIIIAQMSPEGG